MENQASFRRRRKLVGRARRRGIYVPPWATDREVKAHLKMARKWGK